MTVPKRKTRANVMFVPWLLPLGLVLLLGCRGNPADAPVESPATPTGLSVAAAANLQFAFEEIERAFERRHPRMDLKITYGSSGNFFAQLSQKAPFDIFFSADTKYPRQLIDAGLAADDSYFLYARGRIVVWVPNDSSLDLEELEIRVVADPSVRKIAIANPRVAPYGAAAEEALRQAGVYEPARERLIVGENVSQTAHFVESGAADVGILALSLALSPRLRERGRYWIIPADAHRPILQAAVIPEWTGRRAVAKQLRDFVLGAEGRAILDRYGYSPPAE